MSTQILFHFIYPFLLLLSWFVPRAWKEETKSIPAYSPYVFQMLIKPTTLHTKFTERYDFMF